MNRTEIKDALEAEGFNFSHVAEALNVTPSAVSSTVTRRNTSKRIALAICKLIKKPVEIVFPDYPEYSRTELKKRSVNEIRERLAS